MNKQWRDRRGMGYMVSVQNVFIPKGEGGDRGMRGTVPPGSIFNGPAKQSYGLARIWKKGKEVGIKEGPTKHRD